MNFGKADRYITIRKKVTTQASVESEPVESFVEVVSLWAKRTFNPGNESVQADEKVGIQNCQYEVRFYEGLELHMIAVDKIDNSTWEIISVEPVGREDFIRLECFKRDNLNNEN